MAVCFAHSHLHFVLHALLVPGKHARPHALYRSFCPCARMRGKRGLCIRYRTGLPWKGAIWFSFMAPGNGAGPGNAAKWLPCRLAATIPSPIFLRDETLMIVEGINLSSPFFFFYYYFNVPRTRIMAYVPRLPPLSLSLAVSLFSIAKKSGERSNTIDQLHLLESGSTARTASLENLTSLPCGFQPIAAILLAFSLSLSACAVGALQLS